MATKALSVSCTSQTSCSTPRSRDDTESRQRLSTTAWQLDGPNKAKGAKMKVTKAPLIYATHDRISTTAWQLDGPNKITKIERAQLTLKCSGHRYMQLGNARARLLTA